MEIVSCDLVLQTVILKVCSGPLEISALGILTQHYLAVMFEVSEGQV